MVLWVGLRFGIVVFLDHTHLLYHKVTIKKNWISKGHSVEMQYICTHEQIIDVLLCPIFP